MTTTSTNTSTNTSTSNEPIKEGLTVLKAILAGTFFIAGLSSAYVYRKYATQTKNTDESETKTVDTETDKLRKHYEKMKQIEANKTDSTSVPWIMVFAGSFLSLSVNMYIN